MVRIGGGSEGERLDEVIESLCRTHGFQFHVGGWARKTYDVFYRQDRLDEAIPVARIESYATVNGEIRLYDDRGLPFASDLGKALEAQFGVKEAVILREKPPT